MGRIFYLGSIGRERTLVIGREAADRRAGVQVELVALFRPAAQAGGEATGVRPAARRRSGD